MEKKIGVYICKGCGIGDSLDVEALATVANDEFSVAVCKDHEFLCSKEGVQVIKEDLAGDDGVNTVVVAACSPRVMQDVFDFGLSVVLDRVNLREQVVWCQPAGEEDTQMLAEDYMRMGITKAQNMEPLEPFKPEEEMSKRLLVVGGGLAGITASAEAAKAGYEVVLVEKAAQLGGWMNKVFKQAPLKHPYTDLEDVDIAERIKAVSRSTPGQPWRRSKVLPVSIPHTSSRTAMWSVRKSEPLWWPPAPSHMRLRTSGILAMGPAKMWLPMKH